MTKPEFEKALKDILDAYDKLKSSIDTHLPNNAHKKEIVDKYFFQAMGEAVNCLKNEIKEEVK